jgi:hypothetical protein
MFYETFLLPDEETGVSLGHTLILDDAGEPVADRAAAVLDMRANASALRAEARWLGSLVACNVGQTVPAAAEALHDAARRGARLLNEPFEPSAPQGVHRRQISAHEAELMRRAAGLEDWAQLGSRGFTM